MDTFTVEAAADVSIQNLGAGAAGVDNATSITNSGTTTFNGTTYKANSQTYNSSTGYILSGGATTTFSSSADQIQFQSGSISLGTGSNFAVDTAGSAAVLTTISGQGNETVNITTGSSSAGSINVGAITSVGAVTLESGTDSLVTSSINSAGTVDLDGDAAITIGGLVKTSGGNNIDITTNGALSLNGGLDTSNAGSDTAGTLTLNSSISNIVLSGNTIIRTNGSSDTALTLAETIDATSAGTETLTIDTGTSDSSINSAIGGTTNPGALVLGGNDIVVTANLSAAGITISSVEGSDADSVDLTGRTVDAKGGNLTINTDDFITGGSANLLSTGGGATLTLTGESASTIIDIGDSAAGGTGLDISEAELQDVAATFSTIAVGMDSTQTGAVTVNDTGGLTALNSGLTLRSEGGGGSVTIGSTVDLTNTTSTSLVVEGASINLDGSINTDSGSVTLTGPVEINAAVVIDTENGGDGAGGNISFSSTIVAQDGAVDTLAIDATGTSHGTVTISGNVGDGTAANDLDGFTITQASVVDLANVQVDAGNIAITSADIDLNGATYKANTSGSITFSGPVGLDSTGKRNHPDCNC